MRINFLVNEVAGGWEPTDTRLGGTEESVVRWAEELVSRGHSVSVYRNGRTANNCIIDGVTYLERWQYDKYPMGICINIKSSEVPPKEPTLYLTNETNATELDLSAYKGIIWPSEWALENIPVNNPNLFVLPHGYDSSKIYPSKKIRKQCFYASSPDRGLETLLQGWSKIHEAHPDATLLLSYGVTGINLPNVICLGDADEETMNEVYKTSEYWLHPCNGGELYGITGIKAQAAGCYPVYIPTMALSETVKYGKKSTKETFADDVIEALNTIPEIPKFTYPDWSKSTDRLEEIIKSI